MLGLLLLLSAILPYTEGVPIYTNPNTQFGKAYCAEGYSFIELPSNPDPVLLVHEYLHVYDCKDNGSMDGSPYPYPEHFSMKLIEPGHYWVYWALSNPEEAIKIIMEDK